MAKYILRNFAPGTSYNHRKKGNNLFNLSNIGLNTSDSIIKSSLSYGVTQTNGVGYDGGLGISDYGYDFYKTPFAKYRDITTSNGEFVAFFNKSYTLRRDYLRQFAKNGEITFVLETIADEAIVFDNTNYFAILDEDKLKASINANNEYAQQVISEAKKAFNHIYAAFGFDKSDDAWSYFKKFLIDGFLAFEIIYEYDENKNAKNIVAFKEIDPVTLEPNIAKDEETGKEIKIWYQYKGDATRERIIPDANIIYISWCKGNFIESSNVSYLEGLTRSFNMLRQLENSRLIWNVENAQKRVKITVPVGNMSIDRQRQRLSELRAFYNEETVIDDFSGEITVNGMPKFSFTKTFLLPSQNGAQTEIGEIGTEGYNLEDTGQLKYFWRRFILESKVPANRFMLDPTSGTSNSLTGDSAVTREEYAFSRFINRIQAIFKDILLKPLWIQICLKIPALSYSNYLRSCLNIKYNEENLFTLQKERDIVNSGAQTITTLSNIQGANNKPYFSIDFLVKKYLGLTDDDLVLNKKYKNAEELKNIKNQKEILDQQQEQAQKNNELNSSNEEYGPMFGQNNLNNENMDIGMPEMPMNNEEVNNEGMPEMSEMPQYETQE